MQTKIKKVERKVNKIKNKADKARAKAQIKSAEEVANQLKGAEKRLKELKDMDAVRRKKEEISKLESKLTMKGQLMTTLNEGIGFIVKEGKKQFSMKGERQIRRKDVRKRRKNK